MSAVDLGGDAVHDVRDTILDAIDEGSSLAVVHVIDTATNSISDTIAVDAFQVPGPLSNIGVNPDGSRIYVGGLALADGDVHGIVNVIDTATGTVFPGQAESGHRARRNLGG